MRNVLIISMLSVFSVSAFAFGDGEKAINKVIQEFSKAGDDRNTESLKQLTSENYRIVMNQLFGSTEIAVMDKKTYLDMIDQGKFGGDKRTVKFHSVTINGNNAVADVTLKGEAMTMRSMLNLSRNAAGKWILVSDTPTIVE